MAKKNTTSINMVLQLQTMPAMTILAAQSDKKGLHRYRKELIRLGKFVKASAEQSFEVTSETLDHWISTFQRWIANGNKVSIPLSHATANEPEKNQGWVTDMFREDDTLIGILELQDERLALTTDVSICVQSEVIDGRGIKYTQPIVHVALCTDPVIPGLEKFEKLSLSLSKGDSDMLIIKDIAKKLGLADDVDEAGIIAEITRLKKQPVIEASQTVTTVDPLLAKVVAENRGGKLSTLVKAGLISPAVKDMIDKRYVESAALTLSLSKGGDDGFDLLIEVLTHNKPDDLLNEKTGPQILELANTQRSKPNAIQLDVQRRRTAAGLNN